MEANSGVSPTRTNLKDSGALSDAMRTSQGSVRVRPSPTATPLIAAMIGLAALTISCQVSCGPGHGIVGGLAVALRLEASDVGSGAESSARAGPHDGADGVVGVPLGDLLTDLVVPSAGSWR